MEWQDDVDEEERGLDKAFTLIHECPSALPLKARKEKGAKAPAAAEATRDLQLGAFHALFKGEPLEQRLARAAAAQRCWDRLASSIQVRAGGPQGYYFIWQPHELACGNPAALPLAEGSPPAHQRLRRAARPHPPRIQTARQLPALIAAAGCLQETLEGADAPVFQALLNFAQQSHQVPSAAPTAPAAFPDHVGCQRLPTGLVLAGGVNSADHCRTFPNLAAYLRGQGCYVALLQPHTFGRVPGEAIGETLRQMSGLADSRAEHMAALVQWYRDETAAGAAGPASELQQASAAERSVKGPARRLSSCSC